MKTIALFGVVATGLLGACATTGTPEQISCYQPNRRVTVEIVGTKVKPAPAPKPGEAAGKPENVPSTLDVLVQGDSGFDFKSAMLKDEGKKELEGLANSVKAGVGKDTRPLAVGSVVITGHSDRFEAREGDNALSESRAKAVMEYLVSKGVNPKLVFWEGKGSRDPIPVTKFCA